MSEEAEVPGRVLEEVVIRPGGYLVREMKRGQMLRVIDVEGQQVADFIAFNRQRLRDKFWISNTIKLNGTIYVTKGHVLYSEMSEPLFTIVEDTCGRHDLLAGSCNAQIDKLRYGVDDHPGCVENFTTAIAPYGLERHDVPMALNIFMNCPVQPDGGYAIAEPLSKPGDHIDMRAEMDVLFAISNCPEDLNSCNAGVSKPLRIVIYE